MRRFFVLTAALVMAAPSVLAAQDARPSLQNSFQLGSGGGGIFCRVQSSGADPALENIFDRAWSIVCPDAAEAVGRLYALRTADGDPAARLSRLRDGEVQCEGEAAVGLEELDGVRRQSCRLSEAQVGYHVYALDNGRTLYVAEGLAGYDSALRLGLRTIVADRFVPGEVAVATTGAGDPAAFARVQAGTLDRGEALEEAYRRNNSGSYAEAAEFFSALLERAQGDPNRMQDVGEFLINHALQKSNLGAWGEADVLFAQAAANPTADPIQLRLRRNFHALHYLNQRRFEDARTLLDEPVPPVETAASGGEPVITREASAVLNSADPVAQRLAGSLASLTPEERARILDDQALILRAIIERIEGRPDIASSQIEQAMADLLSIRDGRVTSIARLRAQGLNELALIAEQKGANSDSEGLLRQAIDVVAHEYPDSVAATVANARLAAFLARRGRRQEAIDIYRAIVARASDKLMANNISGELLAPYFAVLADEIPQRPELIPEFFLAGETLVRPGVAQTQAVLARELSGGSDEASRLFRQAVAQTRDIERTRVELARLEAAENLPPAEAERVALLRTQLEQLQQSQTATQAELNQFPRFRVVSSAAINLADLQASLRSGEAYYKMIVVGDDAYAVFATPNSARAFRIAATPAELEEQVDALRATISVVEDGQTVTYPFDLQRAHHVFEVLFAPVANDLSGITHLVFEPSGAMLRLPPNLLVMNEAGIAAYRARSADSSSDGFDFTDVAWLGRDRDISTAVSARAFRDVRQAPPSRASSQYIGFGQNAPASAFFLPASGTRSAMAAAADDGCAWSLSIWNQPISAEELVTASNALPGTSDIVTGGDFTDTAIKRRGDLDQYRIMHFATHGLVSAPRPECPARPALMTSFGDGDSDGLLSFREIFELDLDADLIILSACDTAAQAGLSATREAGVATGGEFALDGLVRAFVGAGGRLVVASHWPVPDDFHATQRLISGLFIQPPGTATASALREARWSLMDDPATSHPYYWSGFAVVGDGTMPVIRPGGAGEAVGQ